MTREEKIMQQALNYAEKIDYDLWLDTEHPKSYVKMLVMATAEDNANWADEHQKNPWISVNDRLPEDGQQILEAYTMECMGAGNKSINEKILFSYYRGKFVCDGKETNYGIGKSKSTTHHWMPIPELPKGE